MTRSKTVAAVALALSAGLLAACGSSAPAPVDTVRKSPDATLAKRTVKTTFTQTSDASGTAVTSSGDGGYDLAAKSGRLNLTINGVPGIPDGSKAEVIITGTTVYAHLLTGDQNLKGLGITAPWIKLDLRALSGIPGLDLGTIAQAQSANPNQFLLYLRGAADPVTKVGTEPVGTISTTHYKFLSDLNLAATKATGDDATIINKAITTYTDPKIPTEEWVDKDGLVRRVTFQFSVKPGVGKTKPVHQTTSFDFLQFGVPVDTAAPPANQVSDLAAILGKLAGG